MYVACSPEYPGHTDLPSPTPSSGLSPAVSYEYIPSEEKISNIRRGSRSLTDLTARLTVRAGDGHAPPLSLSGKPFRLTFILLSTLVRFPASNPIKPQHPPLVCSPANSLKFHPCEYTSQVAHLTLTLRHCKPTKDLQHQVGIVYSTGLPGYLIPIAPLAFVPHRQTCPRQTPSPLVILSGLQNFTSTPRVSLSSSSLKSNSNSSTPYSLLQDFTRDLLDRLRTL